MPFSYFCTCWKKGRLTVKDAERIRLVADADPPREPDRSRGRLKPYRGCHIYILCAQFPIIHQKETRDDEGTGATALRIAPLDTPTHLRANAVPEISGALNVALADMFALT
jgi:hypothetical protein